ncbi:MAG: bifunctional isocitrate dehydrogenase kinase/phosphatase [Gammaproteobacteria bacterium]|nr:bifunctional isocitrate dehydrogenase kinase/phosphatase [Gammaproteobacteria bacterium]MCB1922691.1 bifunctional isocitrate dehydrogenase kinase/phosphatase [Gammaproteobacteria bacterium]
MTELNARRIAATILDGFNRHYRIFLDITAAARKRFATCDWPAQRQAASDRINLYTQRVTEATARLQAEFDLAGEADEELWREVKLRYIGLLYEHKQPELAETFYNSVFTWLFHRRYYNNDNIFVRPGLSTEYLDDNDPVYDSYYPMHHGLTRSVRAVLQAFPCDLPYEDLNRDVHRLVRHVKDTHLPDLELRRHFQLQVLRAPFYRNKAAYIVGRAINGADIIPFVIPILNNERGGVYVDTLLMEGDDIANLFSFARAYFMVETHTPAAVVHFLNRMLPTKTKADLYTAIGLQKQGKSEFYRGFLHHLSHSTDQLEIAPGVKGMVMTVFTMPSYPYVFKVINDYFRPPKEVDRKTVKRKYQIVKMHDRVGRMADTLEYSYAAFPIDRINDELLEELKSKCGKSLEFEADKVIVRHVYIERRLDPLNLYFQHATYEQKENAVIGFGNALKEMAAANIFAGDLLFKNFGVTRHGRVIFYDYDEIEFMTAINFRRIPPPRTPEDEMAAEPWYSVAPNDVFPEEFASFLLVDPDIRKAFMKHHRDLLDAAFWKGIQADIEQGVQRDVFPYSASKRFCNIYAQE